MSGLTQSESWKALEAQYATMKDAHMKDLFAADKDRFSKFSMTFEDILLDYSKNRVTEETMYLLYKLAEQQDVTGKAKAMFSGAKINDTEGRAVLHVALRNQSNTPIMVDGKDVMPEVNEVLARIKAFTEKVRSGEWKGFTGKSINTVVNIGIGGRSLYGILFTSKVPAASVRVVLGTSQTRTLCFARLQEVTWVQSWSVRPSSLIPSATSRCTFAPMSMERTLPRF